LSGGNSSAVTVGGTGGLEAAIKALVAVVLALGTLLVAVKKLIF
jgi:hypothetical protein